MGHNMSQACERHVADAYRQRWLEEKQGAIDAWNDHVARSGLPRSLKRQARTASMSSLVL